MSDQWEAKVARERRWAEEYGRAGGLALNPVAELRERLLATMAENIELYGRRICPCRESTGNQAEDRKLTCPCADHQAEIAASGTCHCTLFGRPDLAPEEWQREISRLMAEFSLDRTVAPATIDGRGLTCPGPVFLAKRSLLEQDPDQLTVLVDSTVSVKNLTGLAARYGRKAHVVLAGEVYSVKLSRTEHDSEEVEV